MKIFLIVFSVLLIGLVSAGDIELLQDRYYSGETLQAYLHNYSSNPLANIYILDINQTEISISPLVIEYEESKYFVYFTLPELNDGVYDLVVVSDIVNFSVENSTKVVGIKPGIFVLDDEDNVKVIVENKGEDVTLSILSDNDEIVPRKTIKSLGENEVWNLFADFDEDTQDSN